jgi:glycosyltransferase involved in cell wall biosynthesis
MVSPRVLLVITADDAATPHKAGPRKDYWALSKALGAETIDRSRVKSGRMMKCLSRYIGVAPLQAWLAFRERNYYDAILTDGEHIGIPLALLLKVSRSKVAHVTIGHRLTASKKRPFFKWLKVHSHINTILLHSRRQYELAIDELGIPAERLALIPYQVDANFWQQLPEVTEDRLICSAGLEFRDYPTLVRAVDGLDVEVVIGAASHWSKRHNTAVDQSLPSNVQVSAFDYEALRRLYARAAIVVVPLDDIDFQAGVTTILEAMSMGKPVIVTHSLGQTDVVEDRRTATRGSEVRLRPTSLLRELAESEGMSVQPTGFYVPPEDSAALRRAIVHLLEHPDERRRLGAAGRETIERLVTVDLFAERVRQLVDAAVAQKPQARIAQPMPLASQN